MAGLLLPAAMSFAPSLIAGLFGNPQAKLRGQINQLMSPQNLAALQSQFYQQQLGSPAFAAGQRAISSGANAFEGRLASRLGAAGIGQSGLGAILSSATPSLVGGQMANLFSAAGQNAQNLAQQSIQARINALLGTQGPSPAQSLFGVGMEAFQPFLQAFMKAKFPNAFNFEK